MCEAAEQPVSKPFKQTAQVAFGDVVIEESHLEDVFFATELNKRDTAEFVLRRAPDLPGPIDFFARVEVRMTWAGGTDVPFAGHVVEANAEGDRVRVRCESAVQMTERNAGSMIVEKIDPAQVVHMLARLSGFDDRNMNLHGLDFDAHQQFDVIAPIEGVSVTTPEHVGEIRLLPKVAGDAGLGLEAAGDLLREFRNSDAYAIVRVSAATLYGAEELGVRAIDAVLAWLTIRARYGLMELPGAVPIKFQRTKARVIARRRETVLVRGVETSSRWLRNRNRDETVPDEQLDSHSELLKPSLPTELSERERGALISAARASAEPDLIQSIQALWEAIEFCVEDEPDQFNPAEREQLVESIPADLTASQRDRIRQIYGLLNEKPIRDRFLSTAKRHGLEITEFEIKLLRNLRNARNDAVHGREFEVPSRDDLTHALSIVSRVLIAQVANRPQGLIRV